ncbi:MAG: hypothetical protein PHT40_01935 [Patescibacteria group bacterium]|nr:hypothetical protein [Patescibacteria group bacterium]
MNFDPSQLNWKKILLIIGFVLVCLGLVILMYFMFFKSTPAPQPGEVGYVPTGAELPGSELGTGGQELGSGGQLPENTPSVGENTFSGASAVANGGATSATAVNEQSILGMALDSGGNLVYYNRDDSRFYKISSDGASALLSKEKFLQLKDVVWSADTSAAIVTYPDDLKIYYNFATNKKVTLPKNVVEPIFSTDGSKISFKYETNNPDNNYVAVSRPDGTGAKLIEPLGSESNRVQATFSPNGNVVAFYAKATGLDSSEIFFIGQAGENFRSLKVTGTNFKGLWSPSGQKILYQTATADNDFNPSLKITSGQTASLGGPSLSLDVSTWVDKCVFASENEIYCAVPDDLPTGAGLYSEVIKNEIDSIYRLNLATGTKEKIADPVDENGQAIFKIGRLSVSADQATLFFWDENTGKMYKIRLK